jgi:conjugative relaxase-like TrwC/TraI family protein
MLTIYSQTSSAAVKKYFDVADYYSEGQETVGRWGGGLADVLDLSGTVDKASFDCLCDNLHPQTGEQLTLRNGDNRRVGYDMVFSGPKSFSILEALAGEQERQRLLRAFGDSVDATMAEMEVDMHCRVRKGGAFCDRQTGNMVWAAFDHSTARPVDGQPPDPQRHRHVFAFNAAWDPVEECFKAGEFSYIKRDGEYYAAAFYARLAHKLEAMGYGIDRRGGKEWEIAGVPQSAIDTFSKRTDEVEETARELGITDAERKAELGATTRARKQKELTPAELRQAWLAQISDGERDALARVYRREIAPDREVTASEAVEYAIAHLGEQNSAFPVRELKATALLHGLGHLTPEQVEAELPRHGVLTDVIDGRVMASTEALQAEERYIVGQAARGRGAACPVGVAEGLSRQLADGRTLSDEQWAVTQGLLSSSNRVNMVTGPAGAGKSYSLQKFDEGMRIAGEAATYLATTVKAVKVLEKDGFEVKTVAHFLRDGRMQAAARGGRVVVDEASMLGHKDAVKLFKLAEKNDLKLIFVGDKMQHGSVPRGALLRILEEYAGIRPFRLTTIMRQQDAEYRAAAQLLSEGRTLEGFEALDRKQWVHEIGDDAERYRAMAADYLQAVNDGASCLVVSPTHAEAAAITREIRGQLRAAGKLGTDEREFTRLVQVNASEAERGQATTYRPGDVIQFHQNAKGGYVKGQRRTVADPAAVPVKHAASFSLYRPEAVRLAKGDLIRFTGTVKAYRSDHTYRNGDTHGVAGFTEAGNLRLDDGRVVAADVGLFRPAFVETSFGAQGQTVQRVILGMSAASLPATNQEQMYVSASRAKAKLSLYTDDKDAVKAAIQRSSQKLAALDLRPAAGPKRRDWMPEDRERQRRLALVKGGRAGLPVPPTPPEPPRQRPWPVTPTHPDRQESHERRREIRHGR